MKILLWALTLMLASCATAPATPIIMRRANHTRGRMTKSGKIWLAFWRIETYRLRTSQRTAVSIYAETSRFDEELADCGHPGLASVVSRTVNLNVFVLRSEREPKVNVNTKFIETRQFDRSIWTVECNSKGVIERAILESVRQ
jgi:hypothetical protein